MSLSRTKLRFQVFPSLSLSLLPACLDISKSPRTLYVRSTKKGFHCQFCFSAKQMTQKKKIVFVRQIFALFPRVTCSLRKARQALTSFWWSRLLRAFFTSDPIQSLVWTNYDRFFFFFFKLISLYDDVFLCCCFFAAAWVWNEEEEDFELSLISAAQLTLTKSDSIIFFPLDNIRCHATKTEWCNDNWCRKTFRVTRPATVRFVLLRRNNPRIEEEEEEEKPLLLTYAQKYAAAAASALFKTLPCHCVQVHELLLLLLLLLLLTPE